MCYWCHWCSTVFFLKNLPTENPWAARANRACFAGRGTLTKFMLGLETGSHVNLDQTEILAPWQRGWVIHFLSSGVNWAIGFLEKGDPSGPWAMGHLALANSGSKKCMFSAGKVCIAFEESTQNWDHLGLCQECKAFRLVPARSASNTSSSRAAGLTDFGSPWKSHKFQTPCRWLC